MPAFLNQELQVPQLYQQIDNFIKQPSQMYQHVLCQVLLQLLFNQMVNINQEMRNLFIQNDLNKMKLIEQEQALPLLTYWQKLENYSVMMPIIFPNRNFQLKVLKEFLDLMKFAEDLVLISKIITIITQYVNMNKFTLSQAQYNLNIFLLLPIKNFFTNHFQQNCLNEHFILKNQIADSVCIKIQSSGATQQQQIINPVFVECKSLSKEFNLQQTHSLTITQKLLQKAGIQENFQDINYCLALQETLLVVKANKNNIINLEYLYINWFKCNQTYNQVINNFKTIPKSLQEKILADIHNSHFIYQKIQQQESKDQENVNTKEFLDLLMLLQNKIQSAKDKESASNFHSSFIFLVNYFYNYIKKEQGQSEAYQACLNQMWSYFEALLEQVIQSCKNQKDFLPSIQRLESVYYIMHQIFDVRIYPGKPSLDRGLNFYKKTIEQIVMLAQQANQNNNKEVLTALADLPLSQICTMYWAFLFVCDEQHHLGTTIDKIKQDFFLNDEYTKMNLQCHVLVYLLLHLTNLAACASMEIKQPVIKTIITIIQNINKNWQQIISSQHNLAFISNYKYLIIYLNKYCSKEIENMLNDNDADSSMLFEAQMIQIATFSFYAFPCQTFFDFSLKSNLFSKVFRDATFNGIQQYVQSYQHYHNYLQKNLITKYSTLTTKGQQYYAEFFFTNMQIIAREQASHLFIMLLKFLNYHGRGDSNHNLMSGEIKNYFSEILKLGFIAQKYDTLAKELKISDKKKDDDDDQPNDEDNFQKGMILVQNSSGGGSQNLSLFIVILDLFATNLRKNQASILQTKVMQPFSKLIENNSEQFSDSEWNIQIMNQLILQNLKSENQLTSFYLASQMKMLYIILRFSARLINYTTHSKPLQALLNYQLGIDTITQVVSISFQDMIFECTNSICRKLNNDFMYYHKKYETILQEFKKISNLPAVKQNYPHFTTQQSIDDEFDLQVSKLWKKVLNLWLIKKQIVINKEKTYIYHFSCKFLQNTHCNEHGKLTENAHSIKDFYCNFNKLVNWLQQYFPRGTKEDFTKYLIQAKAKACFQLLEEYQGNDKEKLDGAIQYVCRGLVADYEIRQMEQQNTQRYIKAISIFNTNLLAIIQGFNLISRKPSEGQRIVQLEQLQLKILEQLIFEVFLRGQFDLLCSNEEVCRSFILSSCQSQGNVIVAQNVIQQQIQQIESNPQFFFNTYFSLLLKLNSMDTSDQIIHFFYHYIQSVNKILQVALKNQELALQVDISNLTSNFRQLIEQYILPEIPEQILFVKDIKLLAQVYRLSVFLEDSKQWTKMIQSLKKDTQKLYLFNFLDPADKMRMLTKVLAKINLLQQEESPFMRLWSFALERFSSSSRFYSWQMQFKILYRICLTDRTEDTEQWMNALQDVVSKFDLKKHASNIYFRQLVNTIAQNLSLQMMQNQEKLFIYQDKLQQILAKFAALRTGCQNCNMSSLALLYEVVFLGFSQPKFVQASAELKFKAIFYIPTEKKFKQKILIKDLEMIATQFIGSTSYFRGLVNLYYEMVIENKVPTLILRQKIVIKPTLQTCTIADLKLTQNQEHFIQSMFLEMSYDRQNGFFSSDFYLTFISYLIRNYPSLGDYILNSQFTIQSSPPQKQQSPSTSPQKKPQSDNRQSALAVIMDNCFFINTFWKVLQDFSLLQIAFEGANDKIQQRKIKRSRYVFSMITDWLLNLGQRPGLSKLQMKYYLQKFFETIKQNNTLGITQMDNIRLFNALNELIRGVESADNFILFTEMEGFLQFYHQQLITASNNFEELKKHIKNEQDYLQQFCNNLLELLKKENLAKVTQIQQRAQQQEQQIYEPIIQLFSKGSAEINLQVRQLQPSLPPLILKNSSEEESMAAQVREQERVKNEMQAEQNLLKGILNRVKLFDDMKVNVDVKMEMQFNIQEGIKFQLQMDADLLKLNQEKIELEAYDDSNLGESIISELFFFKNFDQPKADSPKKDDGRSQSQSQLLSVNLTKQEQEQINVLQGFIQLYKECEANKKKEEEAGNSNGLISSQLISSQFTNQLQGINVNQNSKESQQSSEENEQQKDKSQSMNYFQISRQLSSDNPGQQSPQQNKQSNILNSRVSEASMGLESDSNKKQSNINQSSINNEEQEDEEEAKQQGEEDQESSQNLTNSQQQMQANLLNLFNIFQQRIAQMPNSQIKLKNGNAKLVLTQLRERLMMSQFMNQLAKNKQEAQSECNQICKQITQFLEKQLLPNMKEITQDQQRLILVSYDSKFITEMLPQQFKEQQAKLFEQQKNNQVSQEEIQQEQEEEKQMEDAQNMFANLMGQLLGLNIQIQNQGQKKQLSSDTVDDDLATSSPSKIVTMPQPLPFDLFFLVPFLEDNQIIAMLINSFFTKNWQIYLKVVKLLCYNPANAIKFMHGILVLLAAFTLPYSACGGVEASNKLVQSFFAKSPQTMKVLSQCDSMYLEQSNLNIQNNSATQENATNFIRIIYSRKFIILLTYMIEVGIGLPLLAVNNSQSFFNPTNIMIREKQGANKILQCQLRGLEIVRQTPALEKLDISLITVIRQILQFSINVKVENQVFEQEKHDFEEKISSFLKLFQVKFQFIDERRNTSVTANTFCPDPEMKNNQKIQMPLMATLGNSDFISLYTEFLVYRCNYSFKSQQQFFEFIFYKRLRQFDAKQMQSTGPKGQHSNKEEYFSFALQFFRVSLKHLGENLLKVQHIFDEMQQEQSISQNKNQMQNFIWAIKICMIIERIKDFFIDQIHTFKQNSQFLLKIFQDQIIPKDSNESQRAVYMQEFKELLFNKDQSLNKLFEQMYRILFSIVQITGQSCANIPAPCIKNILKIPIIFHRFFSDDIQNQQLEQSSIMASQQIQSNWMPTQSRIGLQKQDSSTENQQFLQSTIKKQKQIDPLLEKVNALIDQLKGPLIYFLDTCITESKHNNLWLYALQNPKTLSPELKICYIKIAAKQQLFKFKPNFKLQKIEITVQRDNIWHSTIAQLMQYEPVQFVLNPISVSFQNEEGQDAGGVKREWINLLFKEILDPRMGLFQLSTNKSSIQPSKHSVLVPNYQTHFRYFGRILAIALLNKLPFSINFTKSFLKIILGRQLNLFDIEDIDPDVTQNLVWLLDNKLSQEDAENMALYFVNTLNLLDQQIQTDLILNGSKQLVQESNKHLYIKAKVHSIAFANIKEQIQILLEGFYEIIPHSAMQILNQKELGQLLAGNVEVNIEEMKKIMQYGKGYTKESIQIKWFWEIMEEWDQRQRSSFLFFLTAAFSMSFGIIDFKLSIEKKANLNSLPIAHTCFYLLELPEYQSKEIMKQKLEFAIENAEGLHIK